MSSGAELAVIAAPVAGAATLAVGALTLAAGVVVVGGVALVGVGRLGIAAGEYVADRMRARARVCAGEYARFQQLRTQVLTGSLTQQVIAKPSVAAATRNATHDTQAGPIYHEDQQVAARVAAIVAADLRERQVRYEAQLSHHAERAQLRAALAGEEALPLDVVALAQAALGGDETQLSAALQAVRAAQANAAGTALKQAKLALREHAASVEALLAILSLPEGRQELMQWQQRLNGLLSAMDERLIRDRLRAGSELVARWQLRLEADMAQRRAAELADVWGLLQTVGGLFSDLQGLALESANAPIARLTALSERYDALESDAQLPLKELRIAVAALQKELLALQAEGLTLLDSYYRQRLTAEVEAGLRAITFNDAPFTVERSESANGQVRLRARQGKRTLDLRVRANGKLAYHAHGFGNEDCLEAVYRLIDQLSDRGVQLAPQHPALTHQTEIALRVIEALKQLARYRDDEITVVSEDDAAIVIEASRTGTSGYQRSRINVDDQGNVREEAPAEAAPEIRRAIQRADEFVEAVQQREVKVKQRHPALDRRQQQVKLRG